MDYNKVIKQIKALPKATLLEIAKVSGGDGHSIFTEKAYRDAGMPEPLIKHFSREFKSDTRDYKSTIFGKDGKVVPKLKGIYGLTVVEAIVSILDLPRSDAMGRGFRAQHDIREIQKHCGVAVEE